MLTLFWYVTHWRKLSFLSVFAFFGWSYALGCLLPLQTQTQQVSELQQRAARLEAELAVAQAKHADQTDNMAAARRELDQQRATGAALTAELSTAKARRRRYCWMVYHQFLQ